MIVKPTWDDMKYFNMINRKGLVVLDNGEYVRLMRIANDEIEVDKVVVHDKVKLGLKHIDHPNYDYIGVFVKED